MAQGSIFLAYIANLLVILSVYSTNAQVLTPPYFNLAVGRRIEASATCGENVDDAELFCKLTGANPGSREFTQEYNVIQGQLCDYCDRHNPNKSHPADYAVDGTERWWQSPPLSRGIQFNQVNLTLQLGQEFHVAYVFIKMGNSPRPGVFALERSIDNGQTWKPWQYFADTKHDCNQFFGEEHDYEDRITRDDSVVCTTGYSNVVPLEGGEIVVSLVNGRPSANNFSYSDTLQDWTKATSIRLRLLRTKTLLGHLMAVARQDPTVTRRYFYSVKDISIGGRCVCNGHAEVCDKTDPFDQYRLLCRCRHNTCGPQCNVCCPGFVQKPWEPATLQDANACEPCQCYEHSNQCHYDEEVSRNRSSVDVHGNYDGGGVCENCRDNTEGINCEKCVFGYYRPQGVPRDARDACQQCSCDLTFSTGDCEDGSGQCICKAEYRGTRCDQCNVGYFGWPRCQECECNVNGTLNSVCEVGGGQCPCKANYDGYNCDRCAYGYYGFPECKPCGCDSIGGASSYCDPQNGQCTCNPNYGGRDCADCASGYYGYPACTLCNCDPSGCDNSICEPDTGSCMCRDNFGGQRCDRCNTGFYRHPFCLECECASPGSQGVDCDASGQCTCQYNFAGSKCERCAPGYYKFPQCLSCDCDMYGSYGVTCDQQIGECDCKPTFMGLQCDQCKPNFYNYPMCEECNCNPAGAREIPNYPRGGCGSVRPGTLCECKENVNSKTCDTCNQGYWNLNVNNPVGCEECGCMRSGTTGSQLACNSIDGQCVCRPYASGRACETCVDGTYNHQDSNVFGCQDCDCDVGGSLNNACDKDSGACKCRPRVNGRRCDNPLKTYYFPTLYQHKYEMEDGRTPTGGAVRYGFDEGLFPDYSWRGFAVYSTLQDEILVDVDVHRPSLYRLVFRYVNNNPNSIQADVSALPENPTDVVQSTTVLFQSTGRIPQFATVSSGTFVLNPGRWAISLKTSERLLVDYLVLLPQNYYEASVLQDRVNRPCTVPGDNRLCKHFTYVDCSTFPIARGEDGYFDFSGVRERTQFFRDREVAQELGTTNMAYLDNAQNSVTLDLYISQPARYVLFVQYHSRASAYKQQLDCSIQNGGAAMSGSLQLPGCPYSSLCRQLIVDGNGDAIQYDMEQGTYRITLSARDANVDVAIDSIVAIPIEMWNLIYIQPQVKCVRRDKQCIDSSYLSPTGTVSAEVESGPNEGRVATDVPPSIIDTSIKVIKLDGREPTVNVKASVINPGPYAFVVHYYQPYDVRIRVEVEVFVDNVANKGTFDADYCPSVSGCRKQVTFPGSTAGNILDVSDLDITVSFNNTSGKPVWLDYIMVIPAVQFRSDVLDPLPVDKSAEFIQKCGQDGFYIDPATRGFCRDAVYSLTADYNNGALTCSCNIDGSTEFTCELFGGQCKCRPDVIGRTCSQCRTGYYGFPNCRACNCPSGLCDPESGKCVCPPRVTGPSCNTCLPQTFGFDPLIGCEECNCDPQGVMNNNMECDITTGMCSCKANIGSRRCNQCVPGYAYYPSCLPCSCDRKGTTEDVCNQITADCMCKDNVQGVQCSQCKASTFYLEDRNTKGCTKCFCFGITEICESSSLRRSQVQLMNGWGITNLRVPMIDHRGNMIEAKVDRDGQLRPDQPLYWVAPEPYLGNKVTSYGGNLIYTVKFSLPRGQDSHGTIFPDIRIEGANMSITHISPEQPVADKALTVVLDMIENNFKHEHSGKAVTREQYMRLMANIESLHIRSSYYSVVTRVSLSEVTMDIATDNGSGALARNVEQCRCPSNYIGTSCEQCAPGYYRSISGLHSGSCVPCSCNGMADTCDPETGNCINCRENTGGINCQTCKPGYYIDPYTRACTICSCPRPIESNNFADTCELLPNGRFDCECKTGYTGFQCDTCDYGYWGNPSVIGGECRPCDCSGNININDRLSCDISTGACRTCDHNTAGDRCERCSEWHYGDAIDLKDCNSCVCNQVGTEECNHRNGDCRCKKNVIGFTCDNCARGFYGFDSGNGCEECACAAASINRNNCDLGNGQCQCQVGVTGRTCNQCQQGYWDYGYDGCKKCDCESEGATTCDPKTGQCQCLPGVTGPKCDTCLDRWVLIPAEGCQECDNCIHILLDDLIIMDRNLSDVMQGLDSVSVGVGAIRRLEEINKTISELRPKVDGMITDPQDPTLLDDLKDDLRDVQEEASDTRKRADKLMRQADVTETDAAETRKDAEDLGGLVDMAVDDSDDAVRFAQAILDDILSSKQKQDLEKMLEEAEDMLKELQDRDFEDANLAAEDELDKAVDALNDAKSLHDQAMEQVNRTMNLAKNVEDISDKLADLMNNSRHALDHAQAAKDINNRNLLRKEKLLESINDIVTKGKETRDILDMARDLLDNARNFLNDAHQAYEDVDKELSRLDPATEDLKQYVDELTSQNLELRPLVDNATEHALKLRRQAEFLDNMIADTRDSAEGALNASNAYAAIVDAINEAMNASKEANDAGDEALDLSNGLAKRALESYEKSKGLKLDADDTKMTVTEELHPRLDDAKLQVDIVEDLNDRIRENLDMVNAGLDMLPEGGYEDDAKAAAEKALDASERATDAKLKIQAIKNRLPDDQQKVSQIPYDIEEANQNIRNAQTDVTKVTELVPQATDLMDRLTERADQVKIIGEDLTKNINVLKERIGLARGEASRIRVGMSFHLNTSLQLRNPKSLQEAGAYSRLSLYFKTNKENGFLAYVGPDGNSFGQLTTDDYLSLEVVDGQVVFKYDLGTGEGELVNPKIVSDDMWHEVIAERIGKTGTLTIRTQDEDDATVTGESPGAHSVLDLHPMYTRIFVGGVPIKAGLEQRLGNLKYQGCIEDVKFGGVPIGLWDFVFGQNNKDGCQARSGLEVPVSNGFRFDGSGYVVMAKERFDPSKDATVTLKFRTFAENGLLMLMGDGNSFLSIELQEGRILYQYDLGSGPALLFTEEYNDDGTKKKFNDGQWHEVYTRRIRTQGIVKVDGFTLAADKSPGLQNLLKISNEIHIGGYKGGHNYPGVTSERFQGCIKDLQLGRNVRDMKDNLFAYGVISGCSETARTVSFSVDSGATIGGGASYIAMGDYDGDGISDVKVDADFAMTLRVKTENEDGLVFYVSDGQQDQQNGLSVSVVKGKIVMISTADGQQTRLETTNDGYNDGGWHYISVSKSGRNLQLDVDDKESITSSYEGRRRINTVSLLYFGGLPYRAVDANVGTNVNYIGCIGDVTINGEFLNFASGDPSLRLGASLASCQVRSSQSYYYNYTYNYRGEYDTGGTITLPIRPSPGVPDDTAQCALPLRPEPVPVDAADGTRFGLKPDSRWEFDEFHSNFRVRMDFEFEFKSTEQEGIMFYVSDDRQKDFIAILLKDGNIVYGFNCGDTSAFITSTNTYNDGQWHSVKFSRDQKRGWLEVDGVNEGEGRTGGDSRSINVQVPHYIGGVTSQMAQAAAHNLMDQTNSLVGCMRNWQLKGTPLAEPHRVFNTEPCSDYVETGTFFGADGGFTKVHENFNVDLDLDLELEIRPRNLDGVIMSIKGESDYLVLQMVNGDMIFSMDNGAGEVKSVWSPPTKATLCNGQWHKIKGLKAKNVITIDVDGVFSKPGIGEAGVSNTDTNNPLYFGGVPDLHRGIKTTVNYVGCMRNVIIGNVLQSMGNSVPSGDVTLNSCPTN